MIMGKKGKEAKRREKKQRTGKKHISLKPHDYYEVSGDSVNRKRKNCPRCGPGTWLGDHKGRLYCGKCGYTEFDRKPSPEDRPESGAPAEAARPQEQKPAEEAKEDRPQEQPKETPKEPEQKSQEDTQKGASKKE